ncbi:MAG: peptide transporter substrate-binding protein [Glaciihabitans sp.]|nr:peptide transporter substrate-binding protein [Glaciihabitans sp.]
MQLWRESLNILILAKNLYKQPTFQHPPPAERHLNDARSTEGEHPMKCSKPLRVAAIAAAAMLALAACSPAGSAGSAGGTNALGAPTDGGDLVYAVSNGFTNFDSNVTAAAADAVALRQVYDSLVDLKDGEIVPWLATGWTVSDDGLNYEFTLRDDVTFQDGSPFNADAVCFNFDRIADPATGSLYAVALIGAYASCAATDATTAVVTLSEAYTPLLANLSSPFLGMVSPTAVAADPTGFAINPVGTGPFSFVSFSPDSELVLERNDDYNWAAEGAEHDGPAYVDSLTFQIISDATVRTGSLTSGDVDVIDGVPAQQVQTIEANADLSYYNEVQSGGMFEIYLNTSRPTLADTDVRVAIAKALDIDSSVAATYFGAYDRSASPLAPTTAGYDDSISPIAFDPASAAEELDDAGWTVGSDGIREKDGERLSLSYLEFSPSYDGRLELAEFLKANLADVGIELEVEGLTAARIQEKLADNDYDFVTTSFIAVDPDILNTLYQSESYYNFSRVSQFDEQLVTGRTTPSGDERDAIYADIQRTIVDDAISIPTYLMAYRVATSANIGGLAFDAAAYPVLYDTYLSEG